MINLDRRGGSGLKRDENWSVKMLEMKSSYSTQVECDEDSVSTILTIHLKIESSRVVNDTLNIF